MVNAPATWGLPGELTHDEVTAYLKRIGLDPTAIRARKADLELLTELQEAHLIHVPFDTSAIHIDDDAPLDERIELNGGHGVKCGVADVYDTVVRRHRGGYCFSVNTGWSALLRYLSFDISELVGRVYKHMGQDPSKAGYEWTGIGHKNLLVRFGEARYLSDVGFGGGNPQVPLPYDSDQVTQVHEYEAYKFVKEPMPGTDFRDLVESWTLYRQYRPKGEHWSPVYHISLKSMCPADYDILNYYHSNNENAPFTNLFTVTSLLPNGDRQTFLYSRQNQNEGKKSGQYYIKTKAGDTVDKETVEMTQKDVRACLSKHFGFLWPA